MKTKIIGIVISLATAITAGCAPGDDYAAKKKGSEQGPATAAQNPVAGAQNLSAEQVIQSWKEQPMEVAKKMIQKYGTPQEITSTRLVWHNNGPWLKTELVNEEIEHNFPMPHKDMLKQTIRFQVPTDKLAQLGEYDGSVIVDRTPGEISARCDKEPMNFMALNLANDIITSKKSVAEARDYYAKAAKASMKGETDPYMEKLQFQPMKTAAASPDKPSPLIR